MSRWFAQEQQTQPWGQYVRRSRSNRPQGKRSLNLATFMNNSDGVNESNIKYFEDAMRKLALARVDKSQYRNAGRNGRFDSANYSRAWNQVLDEIIGRAARNQLTPEEIEFINQFVQRRASMSTPDDYKACRRRAGKLAAAYRKHLDSQCAQGVGMQGPVRDINQRMYDERRALNAWATDNVPGRVQGASVSTPGPSTQGSQDVDMTPEQLARIQASVARASQQ